MLSILCVTKAEAYCLPFLQAFADLARVVNGELVIGADGADAFATMLAAPLHTGRPRMIVELASKGYIESVLDEALAACHGDYILRLDDDELASPAMITWLQHGRYRAEKHWKFPRAHLWGDRELCIMNAPLWPDHQTRLSVREMAGERRGIHCGSPFGGGVLAPCLIEHYKFIVKSSEERRAIAATYDRVMSGAGTGGFLPFNLPEQAYPQGTLDLKPVEYAVAAASNDAATVTT